MPSLSEMLAEKKRVDAELAQKAEEAKKAEIKALPGKVVSKPIHPAPIEVEVLQDATGPVSSKEINMDTLRGLYWLATAEHVGDKKATRGQLKHKLNDILLTKDGMRALLKSLQEFVFT